MHAVTSPRTDRPPASVWPAGIRSGVVRAKRTIVITAFLLAYFALQIASYTQRSAAYDEPMHLAAGYAALAQRDHRVDATHPPLVRMWAALPLLGMRDVRLDTGVIDRQNQFTWMKQGYAFAHEFLFQENDAEHLLNWSRFMIVILGAVLALLMFRWVEDWLGFWPAALALGFFLLKPNLSAHATLVTTDLGVTLFYTGTIYFLWRTCRNFSPGNIAGLALCFALAQVTKFSAILLVPTGAVLLGLAVWRFPAMTGRRAAGLALLLAGTAWAVIWAVYGFRYAPSDTPGWLWETRSLPVVQERLPVVAPLLDWVDTHRLLPNAYTRGFLISYVASEAQPTFLAGEVRFGGWWYYFPLAFLIKTPSALLVLLVAGIVALVVRRRTLGTVNAAFVLLPPAVYLGVAMGTGINIGLRHILPVYPFVVIIAVLAVHQIVASGWPARVKWLVLGALAARWVYSFAGAWPQTLTFFNVFVGGPRHGYEYLADSNLDWGQHLKRLKKWMDGQGVERINLAYFGMGDPAYYGIDCILLPGARDFMAKRVAKPELPGYVAIGTTVLSGAYLTPEWRMFYGGFEDLKPVALVGNALRIYWVDEWPEARPEPAGAPEETAVRRHALLGDELSGLGWHEEASRHYRAYLRLRPDSGPAHAALGEALLAAGRSGEAVGEFRRAAQLEPGAFLIRSRLASLLLQQGKAGEATVEARQLVALEPGNPRAHYLLGIALASAGNMGEAEVALMKALELDPDEPVIRRHLAQVRQALRGGAPSRPDRPR